MATYKEIFGKKVQFLSSDPPASAGEGQIWYNSTSSAFKSLLVSEAWSSASPLTTARAGGSGFGIQTAGVLAGGKSGHPATTTATEEYNGSGWSAGGALNTSKEESGGAGILTAGLSFGGNTAPGSALAKTEEYNGTVWAENPSPSGDMGTGRNKFAGFGTQASAIAAGGDPVSTATEEYAGTTWTAGGVLTTGRQYVAGAGTGIPAGLVFGGTVPSVTDATEEYNGTAWTAGGALNTARGQLGGCGTQTAALAFGGYTTTSVAVTETYDGSTWTTSPATLATARYDPNGIGTSSAAIAAGGQPPITGVTEEYNRSANVITAATWASGGSLSNAFHGGNSSFGSTPAGAHVGGTSPTGSISGNTELYDGTAWTANPNACPVSIGYGTGGGPQTAGIITSGESPPGSGTATIKFDGSAWTSAPSRSTGTQNATGMGTQTSFIVVGGAFPPSWSVQTTTQTFDGSTWSTEPNSYPTSTEKAFAGGTAGAAIIGGGAPSPNTASNTWDGSAWTAAPVMLASRANGGYAGTSTDAFQIGGQDTPSGGFTDTTVFDGTTWGTNPSTATGTSGGSAAGFTGGPGGVIKMGGDYGTQVVCEEFAGATSTANYQTITTS